MGACHSARDTTAPKMPVRYIIDKERRLVITTGEGCITPAEINALRNQARGDPDFDREFNEVVDFRAVTTVEINSQQAEELAGTEVFSPNSKIALVVPSPAIFGIGRMYATYNEMSNVASYVSAFYDLPSALKWLGVESLPETMKPEGVQAKEDSAGLKKSV